MYEYCHMVHRRRVRGVEEHRCVVSWRVAGSGSLSRSLTPLRPAQGRNVQIVSGTIVSSRGNSEVHVAGRPQDPSPSVSTRLVLVVQPCVWRIRASGRGRGVADRQSETPALKWVSSKR